MLRFRRETLQRGVAAREEKKREMPLEVRPGRDSRRREMRGGRLIRVSSLKSSMSKEEMARWVREGRRSKTEMKMSCSRTASGWARRKSVVRDVQASWAWIKLEAWALSIKPGGSWYCDRAVTSLFSPMIHICSFSFVRVESTWVSLLKL